MDLPKVRKQLWDLVPDVRKLSEKARHVGAGLMAVAIGALGSPAQPAVPHTGAPAISVREDQPIGKLILQQSALSSTMHAQHYSHSSHASHASHSSHFSHYSSR